MGLLFVYLFFTRATPLHGYHYKHWSWSDDVDGVRDSSKYQGKVPRSFSGSAALEKEGNEHSLSRYCPEDSGLGRQHAVHIPSSHPHCGASSCPFTYNKWVLVIEMLRILKIMDLDPGPSRFPTAYMPSSLCGLVLLSNVELVDPFL